MKWFDSSCYWRYLQSHGLTRKSYLASYRTISEETWFYFHLQVDNLDINSSCYWRYLQSHGLTPKIYLASYRTINEVNWFYSYKNAVFDLFECNSLTFISVFRWTTEIDISWSVVHHLFDSDSCTFTFLFKY